MLLWSNAHLFFHAFFFPTEGKIQRDRQKGTDRLRTDEERWMGYIPSPVEGWFGSPHLHWQDPL